MEIDLELKYCRLRRVWLLDLLATAISAGLRRYTLWNRYSYLELLLCHHA